MRSMQVERRGHAVVALSDYVYVVGGLRNRTVLKSVERYDPKSDTWSYVADLSTPRYELIACVVSEKLYAVGGIKYDVVDNDDDDVDDDEDDEERTATNDHEQRRRRRENDENTMISRLSTVEVYDEASHMWHFVTDIPAGNRAVFQNHASAVSHNGLLYVLCTESTSVLVVYNPQTDCWKSSPAEMVQPLRSGQIGSATLLSMPVSFRTWEFQRKKLLFMHETEGRREFDFASRSWTAAQPWTAAEGPESGIILGNIVSLHGELYALQNTSSCELQMAMYNRTTQTWAKVGKMRRMRNKVCLFTNRRKRIEAVAAGDTRFVASLSHGLIIAFESQTKKLIVARKMNSSRTDYGVAVHLNRAYVFGGVASNELTPFADDVVQEYDFATDSWRFVARMNEKRKELAVVVADGLLYAIGGVDNRMDCLKSAEAYDPLSNKWRLLSPMLQQRRLAKAVLQQTEDAQVNEKRRAVTIRSTIVDLRSQPETYECICFYGRDSNSMKATMKPLESVAPSTNHSATYTFHVRPTDLPKNLTCQFHGIPAPRIVWFRNDKEVDFRNNDAKCVVTLLDDAKTLLQVTHVTADRCTLECRASNFLGSASVKYTLNRVDPPPIAVIASVIVACLLVICGVASFAIYYGRKQIEAKRMTPRNAANKIAEESANELITVDGITFQYKNLPDHIRDEMNKIPHQWLESGSFISSVGITDVGQFLKEALVMQRFQHERVLPLLGISFFKHVPFIVTPFMANGDLHSYLSKEKNTVDQRQLLKFALQIAEGMDYVGGLGVVHRDLACRNCLLDASYGIKICDFGLCRDVDNTGYYRGASQAMPIKNLAPESIKRGAYNNKTDVWSYGVTLWEMWSRGATLYDHIDTSTDAWIDQLLEELDGGVRLQIPEFCPPVVYEKVMLKCWHENSHERPDFNTLCTLVEEVTACCRDEQPDSYLEDDGFDEATNVFLNVLVKIAPGHSSANVAAHDPTSPLLQKANGDNCETQVACNSFYEVSYF